jgi:hypothetical protein
MIEKSTEKLIEKIRVLFDIERTSTSPNEAATAARQALALLRKHGLDREAIVADTQQASVVEEKLNDLGFVRWPRDWQILASTVCALFDCQARLWGNRRSRQFHVYAYGMREDVAVASFLFDYIRRAADRERRGATYRRGFILAVCARLRALKAEAEAAKTADIAEDKALVSLKEKMIEETFGQFNYKKGRKFSVRDREAYEAGKHSGNALNLNVRGIEGTPQ